MSTKDHCLFFKDKQDFLVNKNLNDLFKNLNLNQNNQSFAEIIQSKNVKNHNKKFSNFDFPNNNDSRTRQNSPSFGKTQLTSSFTNSNIQNDYGKKEELKERKTLNANNSTLSLHITAYENSINAISGDGEKAEANKKKENISSIKSWKSVKELIQGSASVVKYAFELPRQQQDQKNDPEVMQFKASQRLSNVNQPPSAVLNPPPSAASNIVPQQPPPAFANPVPSFSNSQLRPMKRSSTDNDGFLHPDALTIRRITSTEHHFIPVSPDMKNARHKLGTLLSGIRKGDIGTFGDKDDEFDNDQNYRKGPGRPKRSKRERRIIYELRNKVFSVRDTYAIEPIYPLMRKWIYGCDDELPPATDELPASPSDTLPGSSSMAVEDSLDLLATKEIHKMPEPLSLSDDTLPPMKIYSSLENPLPEGSAARDLLKENVTAWKNCKKQHKKYMEMRELKYEPSLKLLKTVYAITQQTTQ